MKVKNGTILEFANTEIADKRLPTKLAYTISLNTAAAAQAIEAYNKQRDALVKKYAVKNEDGEPVVNDGQFKIEDKAGWSAEIQELLTTEAEISITTVGLDDVEKCEMDNYDSLSVGEISAIAFMIEQ